MISNRSILFVYGTLKEGGENHFRLKDSKFLGNKFTKPEYKIIFVKDDWPDVKFGGKEKIEGELYLVSEKILKNIDKYEKPYKRKLIELEDGTEAFAYFL